MTKSIRTRPALEPVTADTAHNLVYQEIKRAIRAAHFSPGEVITIRTLAKELQVSETPVREALKSLLAQNIIEILPNRSFRFPILSVDDVNEILAVRLNLEGMAAEQAAKNITDDEVEHLESLRKAEIAALDRNDIAGLMESNSEFHAFLYKTSRNKTLIPIIDSLWLQVAPTFRITIHSLLEKHNSKTSAAKKNSTWAISNHTHLIKMLKNRDAKKARAALEQDLMDFHKVFLSSHAENA